MATATARAPSSTQFELQPLPFEYDALEPVISAETLALHHDKHHKKYVDTMNQLLKESPIERVSSLEDVGARELGQALQQRRASLES